MSDEVPTDPRLTANTNRGRSVVNQPNVSNNNKNSFSPNEQLLTLLTEINGQDTYDSTIAALTMLPKKQYLLIPDTYIMPAFDPNRVASAEAKFALSSQDFFNIAALNYSVVDDADETVRCVFALLRAFALAVGWTVSSGEVSKVDMSTVDLTQTMGIISRFMVNNPELVKLIERAAYIIPLLARHIFHTTGHHYLDHLKAEYDAKYMVLLNAILMPSIGSLLPKPILFHMALHWVTPALPAQFLKAAEADSRLIARIPNAIWLRRNASPAGSALISTSAAVLDSMSAPGFTKILTKVYPTEIASVQAAANLISEDPTKFHITSRAFGRAPLTADEVAIMEVAKRAARTIAPVCQAYINAYASQGSLASAAALKKVANESPYFLRVIEGWFRAFAKRQKEVTSLSNLLLGEVTIDLETLEAN
jgi:hypothetical protein